MTHSITARRALVGDALVDGVRIVVDGGRIVAVEAWGGPFGHDLLAPGFVDLQVNGIDDVDVAAATTPEQWTRLDGALLSQGTTSWCPTLVSAPLAGYAARLECITGAASRSGPLPRIIGAHLEGPFLGGAPGAHRPEMIVPVDLDWIDHLPPIVRLVTVAPEQHGAPEAVHRLRDRGVTVSLGHTTASADQCDAAAAAGATLVTHLFNAMSGLHHRTPGVAAWALAHPDVACSLIADGTHVHPTMLALAMRVLGTQRAVLVTDAVAWRAGTAGPVRLEVRDGAPRLPDGTLAGSVLTMDTAIRTCVDAGVPLLSALLAASTVPARVVGLDDRGTVAAGALADLVALFVENFQMRQAPGPSTRIDITGAMFSMASPSPVPVTIDPHLVALIYCPPGEAGNGVFEVVFRRGTDEESEQVARNVSPFTVEPGKFTYRLVRGELEFTDYSQVFAHCRVDRGPWTIVPFTLLPPAE